MKKLALLPALIGASLLSACASYPTGPSVMAMPGRTKTFEQFQVDDQTCRDYAQNRIGGTTAAQNAANSGVESAAVGTVVGAAAGALIGGHQGAAVGAGAGLLVGAAAGTDSANVSGHVSQRSYDQAYLQCMYAKGERVPSYAAPAQPAYVRPQPMYAPPPPGYYGAPPPPPGW